MSESGLNEFYGSAAQLRAYHGRHLDFLGGAPQDFPVLDLGCGTGIFMELVKARGRAVCGVEASAELVAQGRRNGLDVVHADALEFLQRHPRSYAFVYCSHLIEHFSYADACRLLELSFAALVPGGRIQVNTPNPASLTVIAETFWLDPTHVRPFPLPLLCRMMARAGFEILQSGHETTPGLPRRSLPRRLWLSVLLGRHYGADNTFVLGAKRA